MNTADVLSCHDLQNIQKYQLPVLCEDFIWKSVGKGELLQIDAYKVNKSQGDASDQRPVSRPHQQATLGGMEGHVKLEIPSE